MTRDQFGAWVLIYAAFLVPLAMLAIDRARAAWRQTSRANLEAVMRGDVDAAMKRHPAGKGGGQR